MKIAVESLGGHGVEFSEGENVMTSVLNFMRKTAKDIIVQAPLQQSSTLAMINPSSVNTIRVLSMLDRSGKVKIYSTVLRMGIGKSKVDNASSGGLTCGITENGTLREIGYNKLGGKTNVHPTSGIIFKDYKIEGFERILDLVKKAHPMIPHFRMVSWDVAIDINENPILIEANLCRGELDFHQLNNGPVFGDDTKEILEEVFQH